MVSGWHQNGGFPLGPSGESSTRRTLARSSGNHQFQPEEADQRRNEQGSRAGNIDQDAHPEGRAEHLDGGAGLGGPGGEREQQDQGGDLLDRDFTAAAQNQTWVIDSSTPGPGPGSAKSRSSSRSTPTGSWPGSRHDQADRPGDDPTRPNGAGRRWHQAHPRTVAVPSL